MIKLLYTLIFLTACIIAVSLYGSYTKHSINDFYSPAFVVGDCIRLVNRDAEKWENKFHDKYVMKVLEVGKKKYLTDLYQVYQGKTMKVEDVKMAIEFDLDSEHKKVNCKTGE